VIKTVQASRFDSSDALHEIPLARPDQPSAMANLLALEQRLYILEIGESAGLPGRVAGLQVQAVQISVLRDEPDRGAEIICTSGSGDTWLGREGGTVIVSACIGNPQKSARAVSEGEVRVDNHHHCEPPVIDCHSGVQRSDGQRIRKAGHRTPPVCALQSRPILPFAMAPAMSLAIWARSSHKTDR
jgi:hypothetical protein